MDIVRLIRRRSWDLHRFGFSPRKILERLRYSQGAKIVSISIPKSGTHLLERILCLFPGLYRQFRRKVHMGNIEAYGGLAAILPTLKRGQLLTTHLSYTPERETLLREFGTRSIFLFRDPRDIVVSDVFYIMRRRSHHAREALMSRPTVRDRIILCIEGDATLRIPPCRNRLREFQGWLESDALTLRFEDIIGSAGGGSDEAQEARLRQLWDFVGLADLPFPGARLTAHVYSDASPTFRKGSIGQWRELFDREIKDLFKKCANDMLVAYGYESDDAW